MNKSTGIILAVIGAALLGLCGYGIWSKTNTPPLPDIDVHTIITDTSETGGIAEHIEGSPDAPLVIFEYSDYQCSGCASVVDDLDALLKKYGDKIAIVHRTYVLSYHENGVAAATAVEAAGLQGYWKAYGDYLFSHQEDWYYSDATTRTEQFIEYFEKVTNKKGDTERFIADLSSEQTQAKVKFDISLAKKLSSDIQYTPAFFIDGKFINWAYENEENLSFVDYFSQIIDAHLK